MNVQERERAAGSVRVSREQQARACVRHIKRIRRRGRGRGRGRGRVSGEREWKREREQVKEWRGSGRDT